MQVISKEKENVSKETIVLNIILITKPQNKKSNTIIKKKYVCYFFTQLILSHCVEPLSLCLYLSQPISDSHILFQVKVRVI